MKRIGNHDLEYQKPCISAPGSDDGARHWAIAMTLIQTAKLNGPSATITCQAA
jgi:hypothetical protein